MFKALFEIHCKLCHIDDPEGYEAPEINWLDYITAKSYANNGQLRQRVWELWEERKKQYEAGNVEDAEEYENSIEYAEDDDGQIMPPYNPHRDN